MNIGEPTVEARSTRTARWTRERSRCVRPRRDRDVAARADGRLARHAVPRAPPLRGVARRSAAAILRMYGIRMRVHRPPPWPSTQTIYVSNHTSTLDIFVLVALGLPNAGSSSAAFSGRSSRSASVGRTVQVVVERGGERVEQQLAVEDLHAITPSRISRVRRCSRAHAFVPDGASFQCAGARRLRCQSGLRAQLGRRAARRGDLEHRRQGRRELDDFVAAISSLAGRRARRRALLHARRPEGFRDPRDAHGPLVVPGARLPSRRRDGTVAVPASCADPPASARRHARNRCALRSQQPGARASMRSLHRWCWSRSTCRSRWPASPSATITAPA